MIEKSWNENLNERKEFLEKQLKKLSDLKAQILKWEKETEKKDELWKLNQEIAKIEKELLFVKLQELKVLKDQIALKGKESTDESKKIEKKLSNFENLLASLESKIDWLDAENEKLFEKKKKEIEENFEELQNEISDVKKRWKQVLWNFREEILAQQVQELLPDHDKNANENRAKAALSMEKDMEVKEWDSGVDLRAKRMFQRITGNNLA